MTYRWRFVIHGAIDGYFRMVVYLACSANNEASTVLQLFKSAVNQFGLPSHVRSDKEGKNTDVAWLHADTSLTRARQGKPHHR